MKRVPWRVRIPTLLIAVGSVSIVVALAADLVGGSGGFGDKQIKLAAAGSLCLLGGLTFASRSGWDFLRSWWQQVSRGMAPAGTLLLASWFGLLTGFVEGIVWFDRSYIKDQIIFAPRAIVWMAPVATVLLFWGVAILLILFGRLWPRAVSPRTAVFVFTLMSAVSLMLLFGGLQWFAVWLLAIGLAVQAARLATKRYPQLSALVRLTLGWPALLRRKAQRTPADETESNAVGVVMEPGDIEVTRRDFLVGGSVGIVGMALALQGPPWLRERRTLAAFPRASAALPNVLLIVLDTVRAQSLSLYGYERPTTPNLERLASRGVNFGRALSTAPWTLPSHGSMFTGLWPHQFQYGWMSPWQTEHPTLAEVLRAEGYQTAGFVSNLEYCSAEFGLNRGFVHYEDYRLNPGQLVLSTSLSRHALESELFPESLGYEQRVNRKTAAEINHAFLRWVDPGTSHPFFAFLNYFDAHEPYVPPADAVRHFTSERPHGTFPHLHQHPPGPEGVQELRDAYDGCIRYVDEQVGLLVTELEDRGLLANTLVIVTSDHGEQFGEHDLILHGNSLYMPLLHVPLLMLLPRRIPAGIMVQAPVSLRNLPASIMDLIGVHSDFRFPGESLAHRWTSETQIAAPDSPLLASNLRAWAYPAWYPGMRGNMRSLTRERWHFIVNDGDGQEELFDIVEDPGETTNLVSVPAHGSMVADLRNQLQRAVPPNEVA